MQLRDYQSTALRFGVTSLMVNNGFGYLARPGLGKTATTIRMVDFMHSVQNVNRVLVVAPLRVLPHWAAEAKAWSSPLPAKTLYHASPVKRAKILQDSTPGIYTISPGLLHWLTMNKHPRFDMVVFDESSLYRNWSAQRTKAARRLASTIPYRLLLTGSPAPNCPSEMFAQTFLIDRGVALGTTIGQFRNRFCHRGGFENREWLFDQHQTDTLKSTIKHLYLQQDTSLLTGFPALTINPVSVYLPPEVLKQYKQLEKELYVELATAKVTAAIDGTKISPLIALSGSSKYSMCRQLASGRCYEPKDTSFEGIPNIARTSQILHTEKLEACQAIVDETPGPVLIAYQYQHELMSLQQQFPKAKSVLNLKNEESFTRLLNKWMQGAIPVLLAQCGSLAHGVDGLQYGGSDIIWYTITDNAETFEQFNARLCRSGQKNPVVSHVLIAEKTLDRSILRSVQSKTKLQGDLMAYLSGENK